MEVNNNPEAINQAQHIPSVPPVEPRRRRRRRKDVLASATGGNRLASKPAANDPLANNPPTTTYQQSDTEGLVTLLDVLTRLRQYAIKTENSDVNQAIRPHAQQQFDGCVHNIQKSMQLQAGTSTTGKLIARLINGLLGDMKTITNDVLTGEKVAGPWGALGGLLYGVADYLLNFHYTPGEPSPLQDATNWLYKEVDGSEWISKNNFDGMLSSLFHIGLGLAIEQVNPEAGQSMVAKSLANLEQILKKVLASLQGVSQKDLQSYVSHENHVSGLGQILKQLTQEIHVHGVSTPPRGGGCKSPNLQQEGDLKGLAAPLKALIPDQQGQSTAEQLTSLNGIPRVNRLIQG